MTLSAFNFVMKRVREGLVTGYPGVLPQSPRSMGWPSVTEERRKPVS